MTDKYTLDDLLISAAEQKPVEFEAAFNDLVVDRIRDRVEARKVEIAQQLYNYEPEQEPEAEQEPEYEEDSLETSEEE
jgi:hypothetical protein